MKKMVISTHKQYTARFKAMAGLDGQARSDILSFLDLYAMKSLMTIDFMMMDPSFMQSLRKYPTFIALMKLLPMPVQKMTASTINEKASDMVKKVKAHYEFLSKKAKAEGVTVVKKLPKKIPQ